MKNYIFAVCVRGPQDSMRGEQVTLHITKSGSVDFILVGKQCIPRHRLDENSDFDLVDMKNETIIRIRDAGATIVHTMIKPFIDPEFLARHTKNGR